MFKHKVNGASSDRVNRASSACTACPDGSPLFSHIIAKYFALDSSSSYVYTSRVQETCISILFFIMEFISINQFLILLFMISIYPFRSWKEWICRAKVENEIL